MSGSGSLEPEVQVFAPSGAHPPLRLETAARGSLSGVHRIRGATTALGGWRKRI